MIGIVNRKPYLTLFTILMVLSLTVQQALAKYGGGSGSPEDPYLIYTPAQMNEIGANNADWDKHFKLMADIDLGQFTGNSFKRIGVNKPFIGVFDGNNHKISNFTYTLGTVGSIGIFGYVAGEGALIKNIVLISPNVKVTSANNVASLVGEMAGGTITNCSVEQGTISGKGHVGGLVGFCLHASITDCHSKVTVTGGNLGGGIGGLVGEVFGGTITDCCSASSVSGYMNVGGLVGIISGTEVLNCRSDANIIGGDCVGGLVGFNDVAYEIDPVIINHSVISCCSASGSVSGNELIGGLVGVNWSIISDCYAEGNVSGNSDVGGFVGDNISAIIDGSAQTDAAIVNCYSVGQVSGTNYVGGLVGRQLAAGPKQPITRNSFWDIQTSSRTTSAGGTGKTTIQMKTKSTFTSGGWDFTTPIWTIYEDYPRLWWETTLYVPEEYPTIQAAIDAAVDGDTVIVAEGTYYENININGKNIILTSTNPNDPNIITNTIIDGNENGSVVTFAGTENPDCLLSGFTITNGHFYIYHYEEGGGGIYGAGTYATIRKCTVIGNHVDYYYGWEHAGYGGGICDCDGLIEDCHISNNTAGAGGGGLAFCDGTIRACVITLNESYGDPGGGGLYECNGLIDNCEIVQNSNGCMGCERDGGGLSDCSGIISNCVISNNTAAWWGGGLIGCHGTIINCVISGNTSAGSGGGLYWCNAEIINCVIANNTNTGYMHESGGGLAYCNGNIINCTIVGNKSLEYSGYDGGLGGGLYMCNGKINNSIIWGNIADINGNQIYLSSEPNYSCIQDWVGDGIGNISADPCFVNSIVGGYHLQANSPCINAGDPNFIPELNKTDIDGEPRVMLNRVDMGADEFNPFEIEFIVVDKRRIGRTLFEYDCEVSLTNISLFTVSNVALEIIKASDNMVVIDPNVTFGDTEIGPGESATSLDICTFQIDRSKATDPAEIIWKSVCELVGGASGVQDIASGIYFLNLGIIPGDFNHDNKVDFEDLKILADQWLQPPGSPSADIAPLPSGDGIVNFLDFAILADNWLKSF